MRAYLARAWQGLLAGLALAGCAVMFAMMLVIVADVALRNIPLPGLPRGLAWSNEVSELMLFLTTMLVAPWLLRQGQHIRVDIVLQALPSRLAWQLEWVGDTIGLAACLFMAWYGTRAAWASWSDGALMIKTLVTPEWWWLAPLPLTFVLLSIEMVLRMRRLAAGARAPRQDAVSAA
ncbi:TRAP transporter small permease subunit [Ramlibacter tataouinensis]|uniref:TRAP transporter small permease n=1 Tax=Ramlibacter tataouinensis TaxID=94132 RepID=UPI0022F3BD49|nr:TRAP transporter small permease subunit [Ramlibacter tataouinensis]WBY02676.1 TRAP transporter small permease subunit [Ramlibacter tataouinensis]